MKFFQANKPNGATSERRFFFPSEYHSFSSGDLISGRANIKVEPPATHKTAATISKSSESIREPYTKSAKSIIPGFTVVLYWDCLALLKAIAAAHKGLTSQDASTLPILH